MWIVQRGNQHYRVVRIEFDVPAKTVFFRAEWFADPTRAADPTATPDGCANSTFLPSNWTDMPESFLGSLIDSLATVATPSPEQT